MSKRVSALDVSGKIESGGVFRVFARRGRRAEGLSDLGVVAEELRLLAWRNELPWRVSGWLGRTVG